MTVTRNNRRSIRRIRRLIRIERFPERISAKLDHFSPVAFHELYGFLMQLCMKQSFHNMRIHIWCRNITDRKQRFDHPLHDLTVFFLWKNIRKDHPYLAGNIIFPAAAEYSCTTKFFRRFLRVQSHNTHENNSGTAGQFLRTNTLRSRFYHRRPPFLFPDQLLHDKTISQQARKKLVRYAQTKRSGSFDRSGYLFNSLLQQRFDKYRHLFKILFFWGPVHFDSLFDHIESGFF